MSYWYEPKKKDLDITEEGDELHAYIGDDESGALWVSIKVKDIEDLLESSKKKDE